MRKKDRSKYLFNMILSEKANQKLQKAKALMGITEQEVSTVKREDVTKVFGANIFDMNSDAVNTSSEEFTQMVNFIKTEYLDKGFIPLRILIDGSASALRNTGRAQNLTHKELSEARANNLGAALLSALPSLRGVEIITSGKGMNGDGTSGPSDVYGTGVKGNGEKPPVDVIKAAQAGNRKPVLDFYRQFQFAKLTFQGFKETDEPIKEKKPLAIALVPFFFYLDPVEMTDLSAAFKACLTNKKFTDIKMLNVFQQNELGALKYNKEAKKPHPCTDTVKVKDILATPSMTGDIRFFVTLYVDGKIEVIARGAIRVGGKILSNEEVISSMFEGNDLRVLEDFLMTKYKFSVTEALRNFNSNTLSFKPVRILEQPTTGAGKVGN